MSEVSVAPRAVVERWLDALARHDVKAFVDRLGDNLHWRIVGGDYLPGGGRYDGKAAFVREALPALGALFDLGTLQLDVRHIAADGPTVVVEWVQNAQTRAGRDYEGVRHCLVVHVDGTRIASVREYLDTAYARRVLAG